ncbi:MAG: hypothetical protein AAF725_20985, partial [Acidobacteriota bacterium]
MKSRAPWAAASFSSLAFVCLALAACAPEPGSDRSGENAPAGALAQLESGPITAQDLDRYLLANRGAGFDPAGDRQ